MHWAAMWLILLRLLCFSALLCCEAKYRGSRSRRKWSGYGSRGRKSPEKEKPPEPVTFIHATELNASSYVEKVEKVTNSTPVLLQDKQEYIPFVLFHMSWCAHCKQALPEFERAAEMIATADKEDKLKGLPPIKYFLLQCDRSPEEKAHCDKHAGAGYPLLKLFRDRRVLSFTGNRYAKTMAEWSVHVSRPALLQVERKEDFSKYIENGVLFMMKSDVVWQRNILNAWMDLAFEYIEDAYFCVVPIHSEVAKLMGPDASVDVQGKDIQGMPFEGSLNETNLKQWVSFNQWKVVVEMTPEVAVKLMQSGHQVVAYAHKVERRRRYQLSRDNVKPEDGFRRQASEIRSGFDRDSKKYLFASIDASGKENGDFLSRAFPAVSTPGIFIFSGNVSLKSDLVYWESPRLTDGDSLSLETIEVLMSSTWSRQDSSTWSWYKAWIKVIYRFGTGSVIGCMIVIFAPTLLLGFCCLCYQELVRPEDEEENIPAVKSVDQQVDTRLPPRPMQAGLSSRRPGHGLSRAAAASRHRAAAARAAHLQAEREALRTRIADSQAREEAQEAKEKQEKEENHGKMNGVLVEEHPSPDNSPTKVAVQEDDKEDKTDKKND